MICLVSGKVQGVWFRASTKDKAKQLGITGWAKNLADGRVEVCACGSEQSLIELYEWLKVGPPMAKVAHVHCQYKDWELFPDFTTE